jgi:hypothetical protein
VLVERSKAIIEAAKRIYSIRQFGVKPEHITRAEEAFAKFQTVMRAPQKKVKETSGDKKALETLVKECLQSLNKQFDRLMKLACEDDAKLMGQYKFSRKVFLEMPGRKSEEVKRYKQSRKKKSPSKAKK